MKKNSPFPHSRIIFSVIFLILVGIGMISYSKKPNSNLQNNPTIQLSFEERRKITTDEEWKKVLTAEEYHVLKEKGTERPFTGALLNEKRKGTYVTADCGEPVFRSEDKYDSGTGWPSFTKPINPEAVELHEDNSFGIRTEVVGKECGGHLGHVFDDGPQPTGKRYCINSVALKFIPDEE